MLYYDRIDVSEGIGVLFATIEFFLDKRFKFKPDVCNRYHDVLMISMNLNDIAILNICGVDYHYVINSISKSEAKHLLQNADLSAKRESLQNIIFLNCA